MSELKLHIKPGGKNCFKFFKKHLPLDEVNVEKRLFSLFASVNSLSLQLQIILVLEHFIDLLIQ